jgi:hypothetical protein
VVAYLTGFTRSFDPFGQENVFLVRFAPDGSLDWQRTFEGPDQFGNDRANAVAVREGNRRALGDQCQHDDLRPHVVGQQASCAEVARRAAFRGVLMSILDVNAAKVIVG